jgi:hypothetical protein
LICFLGLPIATSGLAISLYHASLVLRGIMECPQGMVGIATVPVESSMLYGLVVALLCVGGWRGRRHGWVGLILGTAATLAVALAASWTAVKSSSPSAASLEAQNAGQVKACQPVSSPSKP